MAETAGAETTALGPSSVEEAKKPGAEIVEDSEARVNSPGELIQNVSCVEPARPWTTSKRRPKSSRK
jgi:hypothetical protein